MLVADQTKTWLKFAAPTRRVGPWALLVAYSTPASSNFLHHLLALTTLCLDIFCPAPSSSMCQYLSFFLFIRMLFLKALGKFVIPMCLLLAFGLPFVFMMVSSSVQGLELSMYGVYS